MRELMKTLYYLLIKEEKRVQVRAFPEAADGRPSFGWPARAPVVLYRLSIDEERKGTWVTVRTYGPGPWDSDIKARLEEVLNLYRAAGWIQE